MYMYLFIFIQILKYTYINNIGKNDITIRDFYTCIYTCINCYTCIKI